MHKQMTEVNATLWPEDERKTIERSVCGTCWVEGADGEKRRADWPCSTVRAREAVLLLNSMVFCGESHSDTSRAAVRRAMYD